MERAVLVYTTWPSIVEAEAAGREIVEKRLAACVNILPGMISHYWWQGKIERAEEAVMLIKTRAALAETVGAAVKELHTYTTPAIMVLPVESLDPVYHQWIVTETRTTLTTPSSPARGRAFDARRCPGTRPTPARVRRRAGGRAARP